MIDVVYHLFNTFGMSTKTDRLMLPKWTKVSEKKFNEILSTVTEAKNNRFKTNDDGREITLDNAKYKKSTTILLMMWKRYQIGQCLQEVKIKWQKFYHC